MSDGINLAGGASRTLHDDILNSRRENQQRPNDVGIISQNIVRK